MICILCLQVQKFTILEKDFSVPGGELGKNTDSNVDIILSSRTLVVMINKDYPLAICDCVVCI